MSERLTDRKAVRTALLVAVKIARKRIKAFHRVLDRYFGGAGESEMEKALKGAKTVSIFDLMKGKEPE